MKRTPHKLTPDVLATIWRLRTIERLPVLQIARKLGLGHTTIERALSRAEGRMIKLSKEARELAERYGVEGLTENLAMASDAIAERRVKAAVAEHDKATLEIVRAAKKHEDAAVLAERERCAKVCDERSQWAAIKITETDTAQFATYSMACDDCAELIRAAADPPAPDVGEGGQFYGSSL